MEYEDKENVIVTHYLDGKYFQAGLVGN